MPLPDPVPDLASLDLLVSVGETGSISTAAGVHGISQPAASMRLRALERKLGLQLLERTPAGSRLTTAGETTVEWAGVVLRGVTDLVAGAAALRHEGHSHLRVGASMTVAEYLFPGWVGQLTAAVPDIAVALEMGNSAQIAERVASGRVELGFVEGPEVPAGLTAQDVIRDRLAIVVRSSHSWAKRRRPLTPRQLAAAPLLVREVGSGTRRVLTDALAAHDLEPSVLMELGSTTAIKSAVVAGSGVAVLSVLAVRGELASGDLVEVRCAGLDLARWIRAVWVRASRRSDAAATLVTIAQRTGSG